MENIICIEKEKFYNVALDYKNKGYDFLRSLTGVDWGDEGLGVVYHLENSQTFENVILKTLTTDRSTPLLPTVSDIWKGAEINEREVCAYFGIQFVGHPDMRRSFLREDWV